MPLFLCTHQLEAPSASVPLSMIVLTDLIRRRQVPETLRCRMVFPTSGVTSASAWDAPSAAALEAWLNDNLNQDVAHELNEVQEDFAHGLAFELSRARTADRVAANSRSTLQRLSQTASRANDGLHKQLEALELGGNGGFLSAAESALARMRGPAAQAQPGPASAPVQGQQAQQQPPDSAYSRAASTYSWLQSKVRGTGLFNAQHLAPRAQAPSTTHSGHTPPASGLDMGLEHGGDLGLDAAAVAASTGPLPPSYTAATASPSWEEDEPYVMSNLANDEEGADKGQAGNEEQQRSHASEAAAGAAAGAAEARREWEWGVGSDFLEQQQQQEKQQQQEQQQRQQQQSQQGGQNRQESEQRSYAGAVQQAQPQPPPPQQQQQQQQQRHQQQQSQQASKAPMFVLDGDDEDNGEGAGVAKKDSSGSEMLKLDEP